MNILLLVQVDDPKEIGKALIKIAANLAHTAEIMGPKANAVGYNEDGHRYQLEAKDTNFNNINDYIFN